MALTIGGVTAQFKTGWTLPHVTDEVQVRQHTVTFDSSYPTGGEAVTAADFGLDTIVEIWVTQPAGYSVEYDKTNGKLKVYAQPGTGVVLPAAVNDSDDAATDGVAVYFHAGEASDFEANYIGWLEYVGPTNTDGTEAIHSGHVIRLIDDDAAATDGTALFVAPAGGGFYAAEPAMGGRDVGFFTDSGYWVPVQYDADPATNQSAVQVYFDHDATNGERLIAVMADNANESVTIYPSHPVSAEVTNTTDLSSLSARVMVIGY